MNNQAPFDLLTMGRSSIDLYSANIGAPFQEIQQFDAFVGGSPLNIAVGASRLGLNTALLTGVGEDKVGEFILNFLRKENVETKFIPVLPGRRSSAVVLGIEPPDKFPLVFYRDNAADMGIEIDHVDQIDLTQFKLIEISATALSKDPSRTATLFLAEQAYRQAVPVLLDIDFRADQWDDIRAFGTYVRSILSYCQIAIGTREEILAAVLNDKKQLRISDQQISAPEINGDVEAGIRTLLASGIDYLIYKDGPLGCHIYEPDRAAVAVPGFPVEVLNILGAGDGFAAGFCFGLVQGWEISRACRFANACGAYLVTQPGCANSSPGYQQIMNFIKEKGGL